MRRKAPRLTGTAKRPFASTAVAAAALAIAGALPAAGDAELPAQPAALASSQAVALDPAVLREVLRTIDAGDVADESFGSAFWRWLQERLADQGIVAGWLEALRRMPNSALEWFSRLAVAAMIGIVAWIAFNELRQRHGGFGNRRCRSGPPAASTAMRSDWASVAALPPAERPGAALRLALAVLASQGERWVPAATPRELFVHARRTRSAPWRRPLARLAVLAERARYGTWQPSGEQGDAAVALGRAVAQAAKAP